ncbi:hypothetical protein [Sphingomonas abaci]|uniref:Uncharacterized protein n=1 Tax=Sphingomonas abaci TaxID=237611 RepID=A0A7W7AGU3_9SPHN|nr:hypothetical protein [Sphingomonas abaci]MBB4616779.1 hypothetical protein [Sphingomonas abaci]
MNALLLAQAVATATPPLPHDWSALPAFPADIAVSAGAVTYVRAQVRDGHCTPAPSPIPASARTLVVPVAVLVGPQGSIRQIVPQAIDCPSVEQYTVGFLLSATRHPAWWTTPPAPGWYKLTPTYRW